VPAWTLAPMPVWTAKSRDTPEDLGYTEQEWDAIMSLHEYYECTRYSAHTCGRRRRDAAATVYKPRMLARVRCCAHSTQWLGVCSRARFGIY
jgi:hypothetical protein